MNRVWHIYLFFCFGALVDLVTTIVNLGWLGYGFEGNPLINGWFGAVVVKIVAVGIIGIVIHNVFDKQHFFGKYSLVCILLIATIAQLIAGSVHLYVYSQYVGSDNVVHADNGDVLVLKDGAIVNTLRPVVNSSEKLVYYLSLVGIFIMYPYLLALASLKLALWATKTSIQ